ncbi:MAG: FAD:protein FMN transferase [Verrucomicrobiota bacterium]|nr:FAD:protein FMN transferase [Verrucomicrobiota bacterium]
MQSIAAARRAMNARFEIVAHGESEPALRAAAEAALDEIDRLERQISRHRPDSEIALVNREAWRRPVRVSPNVFELLERTRLLWHESGGVFDPTTLPLLECWRKAVLESRTPANAELERATKSVGMDKVELRKVDRAVRFAVPGMSLDLGAIGKGYAIDCAVEVLRENNVTSAFIQGGTSSAHGIGRPPDQGGWRVGISNPMRPAPRAESGAGFVAEVTLHDQSLGVSAVPGLDGKRDPGGIARIVNPLSAKPNMTAVLAAVAAKSATDADALSTAVLAGGEECLKRLRLIKPACSFLLACHVSCDQPLQILHSGLAFSGQTEWVK